MGLKVNVKFTILCAIESNDYIVLAVHSYNDVVAGNNGSFFTITSYAEVGSTYTLY